MALVAGRPSRTTPMGRTGVWLRAVGMASTQDDGTQPGGGQAREGAGARRPAGDLRHHRRSREGDDLPLALPPRAPANCWTARSSAWPATTGRSISCAIAAAPRSKAAGKRSTRRCSSGSPARLSYVSGDFGSEDTYVRLRDAIGEAKNPVFYLEIPPSLFGMVIGHLAGAGLTGGARVVVEKPFGHDLASARALAAEVHKYIDESQLYRIDHFLGKMGTDELLYLRFGNTMIEPIWNRNHIACGADHDGRGLRCRGPRALLRPGGRAARRGRQPRDAARCRGRHGGAIRQRRGIAQGRQVLAVPLDRGRRSAPLRARAVRRLPQDRRGGARLHHRDLCRHAPDDRQLALVGGAVVHPHGQATCRSPRQSCGPSSGRHRG